MKLHQMYHNVLNYSLEALIAKVEEDSVKRATLLAQSMQNNYISPKQSSRLSDQEKAILKALGLSMKDVKALKEATI